MQRAKALICFLAHIIRKQQVKAMLKMICAAGNKELIKEVEKSNCLRLTLFRRKCIPTSRCGYQEVGCAWDDDCKEGLACGWLSGMPACVDIDECSENPDACNDQPCTVCLNLISTMR